MWFLFSACFAAVLCHQLSSPLQFAGTAPLPGCITSFQVAMWAAQGARVAMNDCQNASLAVMQFAQEPERGCYWSQMEGQVLDCHCQQAPFSVPSLLWTSTKPVNVSGTPASSTCFVGEWNLPSQLMSGSAITGFCFPDGGPDTPNGAMAVYGSNQVAFPIQISSQAPPSWSFPSECGNVAIQ